MELSKINGNTYYISAPTNIGVFQFKDKYTLLIDTGDNNQQARKICETLSENKMNIKYILNTHEHIDHSGGNLFISENYPGSIFHASPAARLFMENDYLFPLYLYGGNPISELSRHFTKNKKFIVDVELLPGEVKINDEKFAIISLAGHAAGQIGIATRDRVCFLGDALFSEEIIDKYSFPFLYDIEVQFKTLDNISQLEYDYFVLAHAARIYTVEEIRSLAKLNRENLEKYLSLVLDLLEQPKSREELLEEIIILQDLTPDFKEYYFLLSTTGAMISYLYKKDLLKYQQENGKIFFYK